MKKIKILLLICIFFTGKNNLAQESFFYSDKSEDSFSIEKFGLEVYSINYIKNNEYFNFIADGYTLLANQIHPEFIYNASKKTQIRAGLFLIKNFGENTIDASIPTFTFTYKNKNSELILGNLYARNNHNLIEPIMASEKILSSDVLETGIEYLYKNDLFFFDIWLNWEKYIIKNDDYREEFTLGVSTKYSFFENENHELTIPFSILFYHRGGQINKKFRFSDNSENSPFNLNNSSLGLQYSYKLNNAAFNFGYYYLSHSINDKKEEFPFNKGNAHYLDMKYTSTKINFSVSYFKADKFISAKGNDMFQSYSVRTNNNYYNGIIDNRFLEHTEPNREVISSKLIYKKNLTSKIKLGLQLELFQQLNDSKLNTLPFLANKKNAFDYSYAIYIIASDLFSF